MSQVDETSAWLFHDANGGSSGVLHWSDDLHVALGTDKGAANVAALFTGVDAESLMEKVNEDKFARDVDDLSAIFEELEGGGEIDIPLPFDDEEIETEREAMETVMMEEENAWIGELETDVVNIEELSSMFDGVAAEQEAATARGVIEIASDDDEEMEDDEEKDGDEEEEGRRRRVVTVQIVPAAPSWIVTAPLDPRSCIRGSVFKNLDSRIPCVEIPRMDLGFGGGNVSKVKAVVGASLWAQVTPKSFEEKAVAKTRMADAAAAYHHVEATCWICKSDKTPFKKFALHRYLEKRHRRNWKRGPRYGGRSHVATNRVREGGRFVQTAQWV